jgi:tetratricopeptide (TPR) repeat protein
MTMKVDTLKAIDSHEDTSFHFRESVRLLRELHFLMAEGKSETEEADRVRDLMDVHWYRMSPEEIRRVDGLSADLYTLVDPPPPPQQADPGDIAETCRLIDTARDNQEWDNLLELLRERPHPYPPDRVAFLRATCWEKVGDLETSLLFLEKTVSLNPSNGYYVINLMSSLLRVGRPAEAIALADRTIRTTETLDPDPLYMTAGAPIGSIQIPGDGGQK